MNKLKIQRTCKNFFTIIVLLFVFNSISFAQKDYKAIEKNLNTLIDTFYTNNRLPGITVSITSPEFNYERAVGKADIMTGVDRKINDKIRIGSITKTFVAAVILQLVDEYKLTLDDKLSKFYPSYPNSDNITLREMLNMTSGIPDYLEDPLIDQSFLYYRTNKFTPVELFEATKGLTPSFAPGKGWNYSNGNYNLLGMIIEKVTGNRLEYEIRKRIITPLNLTNTIMPEVPQIMGEHSHGYMKDTVTGAHIDVTEMEPSITWAAGAMISNFEDLKVYAKALAKGEFFKDSTIRTQHLTFVSTGVRDFLKYGLGIFSINGFIGHNGGITGYNTMMVYNPELDATVLASINEFGSKGGKVDELFMYLVNEAFPEKSININK